MTFLRKLIKSLRGRRLDPTWWINSSILPEDAVVVQIGSNDGKSGDPIHDSLVHHPRWSALLVEPEPRAFERLKANYGPDKRFTFRNTAISPDGRPAEFFWIDPRMARDIPGTPHQFDQVSSFDLQHIRKHFDQSVDPYIRSRTIPTSTLPELLQGAQVERIDLFHVDTEGNDWIVLSQLDLSRFQPRIVLFETCHLSADDLADAVRMLSEHYWVYNLGNDSIAIRKDAGTQFWWSRQLIRNWLLNEKLKSRSKSPQAHRPPVALHKKFFLKGSSPATKPCIAQPRPRMPSTTVEVRMPTYNRPDWLDRAIGSLLNQSHQDWRAIVLDDANSSETKAQVAAYSDDRMCYHANGVNLGVTKALSKAFRPEPFFEGTAFACVLEDDNFWHPSFIESNLKRTIRENVDICASEVNVLFGTKPQELRDANVKLMQPILSDFTGIVGRRERLVSALLGCGIPNSTYFWRLHCGVDLSVPHVSVNQFSQEKLRAALLDRPCHYSHVSLSSPTSTSESHSFSGTRLPIGHRLHRLEKIITTHWLLRELGVLGLRPEELLKHPAITHRKNVFRIDLAETGHLSSILHPSCRPYTISLLKIILLHRLWAVGLYRHESLESIRQLRNKRVCR